MLLSPIVAAAQSTATVNGRVLDEGGAVLPGVTVVVTNVGTGIGRTTVTNEVGLYNVPALVVGRYDVRVELSGFAPAVRPALDLTANSTVTVDFTLRLAQVSENVTVEAAAPLVDTTQSVVASSINVEEVQELPILNRNFTGMVALVPGARPSPAHNPTKAAMGASLSFGGAAGRNVEIKVDGLDNRDDIVGGAMQNFTLEGVQEFTLLSHRFSAEYGRTAGAVLQIVTKAGTNQLRGTAFLFGRNDAMTAIDYFAKQQRLPKTAYDRQQFGGSIGGPIKRDRTFFFVAVERQQQDLTQVFAERLYQEALLLQPFGAVPIRTVLWPLRDTTYTIKGDHQLSARHSLLLRWAHQKNSQDNDLIIQNRPDLSVPTIDTNNIWSFVGSETWVIGNNAVNTIAVQVNWMEAITGLPGGLDAPINPIDRNLTFPSLGIGQPGPATQQFAQKKIQFKDDFAFGKGRHSFKVGGDFAIYPDLAINLDIGQRGGITFFDDPSTIVGSQAAWGANPGTCTTARYQAGSPAACGPYRQGFQTPGAVSSIIVGVRAAGAPLGQSTYAGVKQFSGYFQDDWRVGDRLTLNLGIRYDLAVNFLNQREMANNRTYLALKAIGSPYGALPETSTKDFSPRAGFAWDIAGDGRSVLRGGAGIYFDIPSQSYGWQIALQSKPTVWIANNYVNTAVGVGQLANYVYGVSPLPAGPPASPTELPRGVNIAGHWWHPDVTDPHSKQFHIGFTRQLSDSAAVSTDYTHIRGENEFRFGGARQINPIEGPWDPNADPSTYGRRRLAPQFQAAFGDPNLLGPVSIYSTEGRSRFDEWIVQVQQRAGRATFQGSYTLAWARGFGGCIGGGGGSNVQCQGPVNQDQVLADSEYGPTITDERHRVVLSGVFALPWGVQASPIFQAGSGRPYNLTAGRDLNGDGTNNDRYIDPATGQMVGVNAARGEATWNLDARVTKFFDIGASRRLGVFAEIYNITNETNFGAYNGTATSVLFQQPTAYFAGYPTSRQLQLGARFSF
jgi:hypothetical protein